jgi:hypothetical protein
MQFRVNNQHHGLRPFFVGWRGGAKVIKLRYSEKETTFQARNRALSSRPAGFDPTCEALLALWSATVAGTDDHVYA